MAYYGRNSGEKDRRRQSLAKWIFAERPVRGDLKSFLEAISILEAGDSIENLTKFHIYAQGWSGNLNCSMFGTSDIERVRKSEGEFIIFTESGASYVLEFSEKA